MHRVQSRLPCAQLRQYVRAYAQREIDGSSVEIVQPMPASLESIIDFEFEKTLVVEHLNGTRENTTRTSIVGPGTHLRHCIRLRPPVDSFAIFFQPMGARQLFGIPGRALMNQQFACFDVLGQGILRLWHQLAEDARFDIRVRLVEEYLIGLAGSALSCTPVMTSARYIFRLRGAIHMGSIADALSLSVRQCERRFLDEIGMTPKRFAGITRYQMAMDAKITAPARSWLGIAHEFGYHDQMHMIRDFWRICGDSPGKFLLQLGDMRPEALALSVLDE